MSVSSDILTTSVVDGEMLSSIERQTASKAREVSDDWCGMSALLSLPSSITVEGVASSYIECKYVHPMHK